MFLPVKHVTAGETPEESDKEDQNLEKVFTKEELKETELRSLRKRKIEERVEHSSLPVCRSLYKRNNYFIEGSAISYVHKRQTKKMKQRRSRKLFNKVF